MAFGILDGHAFVPQKTTLGDWMRSVLAAMSEPYPHKVYYHHGFCNYVDPKHVFYSRDLLGPSDCVWIVPGSERLRA